MAEFSEWPVAGLPAGAEGVGFSKDGKGRNGQAAVKEKELLLAGNSAGSSIARHGGSVYDILVSEIKVGTASWRFLFLRTILPALLMGLRS